MKKKLLAVVFMLIGMMIMASCGASSAEKITVPDEYNYDDLSKYIELGEYKGIKYETIDNQVMQSEVQAAIDELLAETTETKQKKKGKVKEDSIINIDYVGTVDGVEFTGGSAQGMDVNMADNNFIDGFAEGILGHNAGENFDINVTFPENYGNGDLAGKDAVFNITVNYIEVTETPEYNDEWVKNNTDYKNTEEYEEGLKEEILANKQADAVTSNRTEVFNKILDDSKVKEYPEKEFNSRYEQLVNSYKNYAEANDIEFRDYLSEQMGLSEKAFEAQAKETAQNMVKQELVIHAIARKEDIVISDGDYQEFLDKLLKDAGYTAESYKEAMGYSIVEYAEANNLFSSMLYQKVMDKVMEYSVGSGSNTEQ